MLTTLTALRWFPAALAIAAQAVQAAGATDLLLQRFVPSYGHCNIPADVAVQAFVDLAAWVATGVKPGS
jgi:hypothetical protein